MLVRNARKVDFFGISYLNSLKNTTELGKKYQYSLALGFKMPDSNPGPQDNSMTHYSVSHHISF
jgi:hypothetical protein